MNHCRVCDTAISPFMDFGPMPIANAFLPADQTGAEYTFHLAPTCCSACGMVQLSVQPTPERMFHDRYPFYSSTSSRMAAHFRTFAQVVSHQFMTGPDPFVVEIGSNDGIFLRHFAADGCRHLGVEPSSNVAEAARQNGVDTLCAFFGKETAETIRGNYGRAAVIVAANVLCHIPDIHAVGEGVNQLLADDGVLVFEDPYLGDILTQTAYDQIYDEHVFYFCAASVQRAFEPHGLSLIDVAAQETHGGSMRYVLARTGVRPVSPTVDQCLAKEKALGLTQPATFDRFRQRCEASRQQLRAALTDMHQRGLRVAGYAATSKSTTLLNFCSITSELVPYICDSTPAKQGMVSPGAHIPIRPAEAFRTPYPDVALLLAWNHRQEILANEFEYTGQGGRWLVHVPRVEVFP